MEGLRYGRIVVARFTDPNGVSKDRPGVLLDATKDMREDAPLLVMAITTRFGERPPQWHVPLPWHRDGQATTRLHARSAAVVKWVQEIAVEDVLGFGGDVPAKYMHEIERQLAEWEAGQNG